MQRAIFRPKIEILRPKEGPDRWEKDFGTKWKGNIRFKEGFGRVKESIEGIFMDEIREWDGEVKWGKMEFLKHFFSW